MHRESQSRSKRPRSPSLSVSPPPPKRRHARDDDDVDEHELGSTIWALFGKDRNQYLARDVLSDDEDMEADATALEREEHLRSDLFLLIIQHDSGDLRTDHGCRSSVPALLSGRMCKLSQMNVATKRRNGVAKRSASGPLPFCRQTI